MMKKIQIWAKIRVVIITKFTKSYNLKYQFTLNSFPSSSEVEDEVVVEIEDKSVSVLLLLDMVEVAPDDFGSNASNCFSVSFGDAILI